MPGPLLVTSDKEPVTARQDAVRLSHTPPALPALIEVAFRGNRNEFFLWEGDEPPPLRAAVIVDADRGEDLGHVHALGELAARRNAGSPHGLGPDTLPEKRALRLATPEDVRRAEELVEQHEGARRRAMERVKANGLVMKLSDAEWQWDRKKLTFYFTAEKRVDFRNLVRDLASMFRTRIELKQIGVRDEAKRLDGIGRCGRRYCSASWLPELRPVNLGVAKDQRLSLNPSQISGACGRLMCCLRYEHEFYVQSRKRFPKEGKILVTSLGEEKVVANDIFNDRVTLRRPDGDARVVALADLKRELAAKAPDGAGTVADGDPASPADAAPGAADDPQHGEGVATDDESGAHRPRAGRNPRGGQPRPRPAPGSTPHPDGVTAASATPSGAPAAGGWLRSRSPLPQLRPVAPPPAAGEPAAGGVASPGQTADVVATSGATASTHHVEAPTSADAPAAATGEEPEERRARRRRGRRGGRRGRGAGAPGGGSGGDDAGGAAGPGEGGGDESGREEE